MTIDMFFSRLLAQSGTALVLADGSTVSYAELARLADAWAQRIGTVRRLVVLAMDNSPGSIAAYLGCLRAGHAVYPVGQDIDEPKNRDLIERYRVNCVIDTTNGRDDIKWLVQDQNELHADLALLLSTSGSTGTQKLVKLSRRNIASNAEAIARYLAISTSDRAITTLSPHYSYGLSVINSYLEAGASLVLTNSSVVDPEFSRLMATENVTSLAGVPYTFDLLASARFDFATAAKLRYVTQAGGRLSLETAKVFAEKGRQYGFDFFVMYGQTEAAPRIAYLPADKFKDNPNCIGVPVPGGRIVLRDDNGVEITAVDTPGELAYFGPNVMMGYARTLEELATDDTPECLLTGDIACRNAEGLYYIVGRKARFVKPFGIRIGLDDVERLARQYDQTAVAVGNDQKIVIVTTCPLSQADLDRIAATCGVPARMFQAEMVREIPRLASDKTDYRGLAQTYLPPQLPTEPATRRSAGRFGPLAVLGTGAFWSDYATEVASLLGLGDEQPASVHQIFATTLKLGSVRPHDSFVSLGGDSLNFIELSMSLEALLGELPQEWEHMTVEQLDQLSVDA